MADLNDLGVFIPEIPVYEGCEVTDQGTVFVVPAGTNQPILEWTFTDAGGNPIDLTAALSDGAWTFPVRYREAIAGSEVLIMPGAVEDAAAGKVRVYAAPDIMGKPGVYEANFAIYKNGQPKHIAAAYVLVERSLFDEAQGLNGPPLVKEIQTHLADIGPKNLSLSTEFSANDLALSLIKTIRQWNEAPPAVSFETTVTFAYREHWMKGACGELLRSAASHYRRNRYPVNAGGAIIDDKDKENPYLQASQIYLAEWQEFILRTKVAMNVRRCFGESRSIYEGG